MSTPTFTTVFAVYPMMTHLDFTGPHQVLCRLPGARTIIASEAGGDVETEGGLYIGRTVRLADVEQCDLLCVPGGTAATEVALNEVFVGHVQRLAQDARYVTSVCTGSLILGAAGLLRGKRAACHWAWRDLLPVFGAIPDGSRVVRDGNVLTGGGVTAGIDFAFTMVAEIAGEDFAKALQLGLEYAPAPPFECGRPDLAEPAILDMVRARTGGAMMDKRRAEAETAAARMRAQAGVA